MVEALGEGGSGRKFHPFGHSPFLPYARNSAPLHTVTNLPVLLLAEPFFSFSGFYFQSQGAA